MADVQGAAQAFVGRNGAAGSPFPPDELSRILPERPVLLLVVGSGAEAVWNVAKEVCALPSATLSSPLSSRDVAFLLAGADSPAIIQLCAMGRDHHAKALFVGAAVPVAAGKKALFGGKDATGDALRLAAPEGGWADVFCKIVIISTTDQAEFSMEESDILRIFRWNAVPAEEELRGLVRRDVLPAIAPASSLAGKAASFRFHLDFPRPGIFFNNVLTVCENGEMFASLVDDMALILPPDVTHIVAVESRGYIFGAALALSKRLPVVLARKEGKEPSRGVRAEIPHKNYGGGAHDIARDAVPRGARVVLVDDVLATGGSFIAVKSAMEGLGANVAAALAIAEFLPCNGRQRLQEEGLPLLSLFRYGVPADQ